jgi:hypothetical protein
MSAIASTPIDVAAKNAPTSGRLFFLDLSGGRILSANPDGSDLKTIINEGRKLPDGLVLDVAAGHIYWTNMGDPERDDGWIMRSDLNGKNMITIVPPGGAFTPKQLQLEKRSGKLYWSDREGMRVMRANLDRSEIETLVDTSLGDSQPGSDQRNWSVGVAVDTDGGKFYWTQKGGHDAGLGRIFRANIQVPEGQSAENRRDIELLYDNLSEPIDLDLDPVNRTLYWTERGGPAAWQHGEPCTPGPGGRKWQGARDPFHPFDGRHRPGFGPEGWSNVHYRLRRLGLPRQSRWVEPEDVAVC